MANYNITTLPATVYPPGSAPADVVAHSSDHDVINAVVELFDNSMASATAGFLPVWSGSAYVSRALLSTDNPGVVVNLRTVSYTLVLADAGKVVEMNVASANTATVPPNSSVAFPVGTLIEVCQYGAGLTTVVAGAGVTFVSALASYVVAARYGSLSLRKRATNEWVVS